MNFRLRLAPFLKPQTRDRGAVLPVILGIGLIMTVSGATMIIRSSDEQKTAIAQNQTAKALAIAEGGVSRTLSILNQPTYSSLLVQNKADWGTPSDTSSPCALTPPPELTNPQSLGEGKYRIVNYTYNSATDTGTLKIEGWTGSGTSPSTSDSQTQVEVEVEIREEALPNTFPGLFADSIISMDNNDATGNVICSGNNDSEDNANCKPPADSAYCANPTSAAGQAVARTEIGAKKNSVVSGNIYLGKTKLPPVLSAPATNNDLGNI